MEIIWYGQSCFHLKQRGCSIVTDPYDPESGFQIPRVTVAIVTVSHNHKECDYATGFRGSPYIIRRPGEYEIAGSFVFGISTSHGLKEEMEPDKNTAYIIETEGMTICHLGNLSRVPTQEQIEQLDNIDILLIPVGGGTTIDGAKAAEVVSLLEPRVTIPMHYKTTGAGTNLEGVSRFLSEMGIKAPGKIESYDISKGKLARQPDIVLLERNS